MPASKVSLRAPSPQLVADAKRAGLDSLAVVREAKAAVERGELSGPKAVGHASVSLFELGRAFVVEHKAELLELKDSLVETYRQLRQRPDPFGGAIHEVEEPAPAAPAATLTAHDLREVRASEPKEAFAARLHAHHERMQGRYPPEELESEAALTEYLDEDPAWRMIELRDGDDRAVGAAHVRTVSTEGGPVGFIEYVHTDRPDQMADAFSAALGELARDGVRTILLETDDPAHKKSDPAFVRDAQAKLGALGSLGGRALRQGDGPLAYAQPGMEPKAHRYPMQLVLFGEPPSSEQLDEALRGYFASFADSTAHQKASALEYFRKGLGEGGAIGAAAITEPPPDELPSGL